MRDEQLIGEAVRQLRNGVSVSDVAETVGKDFTADDWTAVQGRLAPFFLRELGPSLVALIEKVRAQEQTARDEAAQRREAETRREKTALSREQTQISRKNLWLLPVLALVAAGVALYTSHQTVAEMHATAGVQTLMALHGEFESEAMRQTRARAATALLRGEDSRALKDVLDFFDTVATLERRGAIDRELAWQMFASEVDGYARAAKSIIAAERTPAVWEEIHGLCRRFDELERRKGYRLDAPTDVKEFLRYESALHSDGTPDALPQATRAPSPPPAAPHADD
jgi:hypothetical protein